MLDMLYDEIQYFGEEENIDHDDDQEIPAEPRIKNGKMEKEFVEMTETGK